MTLIDSARGLLKPGARVEVVEPPQLELMPGGTLEGAAKHPEATPEPAEYEPGQGDLEAAVGLVSTGLATRVVLAGFPSWPGLLWHAYQLAESANVLILPTVVRPGGRVDIVITRDASANG